MIRPIRFDDDVLRLLDQRLLPAEETWLELRTAAETAEAIRDMAVRGAPAIGVTAAYGMVLAARSESEPSIEAMERAGRLLGEARPTAVNLAWSIDRMLERSRELFESDAGQEELVSGLVAEARAIEERDVESNERIGKLGASLVPDPARVLTHCNTGSLATAGYGTALGVIRSARARGKEITVLVDETRPFLQGARLTAWELEREEIPYELITDSMAGALISRSEVDVVIVGADRIAANGDVANKVGTYTLAVLARRHGVPFYVAAPMSTVDLDTPSGVDIPIEERDGREVLEIGGVSFAPAGARARNIAFDVTPAALVSAILTDEGIARAPYETSLARLAGIEPAPPQVIHADSEQEPEPPVASEEAERESSLATEDADDLF